MTSSPTITVFGAYGHTGRFVVAELRRRGLAPILSGRDPDKLRALGRTHAGLPIRPASVDDPASLDRALAGADAVINCAGPFALTAAPVTEAALRARIHSLNVTAEVEVAGAEFEQHADRAREAGTLVVPAMGFYGGLGDLLATAAMKDWTAADEISLAYALDSWKPTAGTLATIQTSKRRRGGRRMVYANHRLEYRSDSAPVLDWVFPPPLGRQSVVSEFLTADSVTIPHHLGTRELRTVMTRAPLADLSLPDPPPPVPIDASGRSAQTFLVEVVATREGTERRAVARGRDIYAVSAPLVVEAAVRAVEGRVRSRGVVAAGEAFDAADFLASLSPEPFRLELP